MKKKIVLTLAAAAALLVLVIVVLFFVVDADDFRGFIETRAEEALGRDVRLGSIGLSVFPVFGLEVDDVAVEARPGEGEGDLLSLRSLRIGARLMPLLQKRLEVTSVELVEPSINLIRDAEGRWNFDLGAGDEATGGGAREAEPGAGPDLTVDSIRVTGGSLSFRDASRSSGQPLQVALRDLDFEIAGFGSDDILIAATRGLLDVADSALGPDPLRLELGAIDLAVRGGGDAVELTRFELMVGGTAVGLTGTIEAQPGGRRIDLDLRPTRIDVADLSSFLEQAGGDLGISLTGSRPIELEAGIHGVLAEATLPQINARATISDITLDNANLSQPVTGISAIATFGGTSVVVDGLQAQIGETDVAGELRLEAGDRPSLDFALKSQRANLGELFALLAGDGETGANHESGPDPESFLSRGIAQGSIEVAEGSWEKLVFSQLDARLRLENGVATLEPVSMTLYEGRFNGRLASDLTRAPQTFEFSGEAENIDMDPFVADQTGMNDVLLGRFTGRVAGRGAGSDPATMIQNLEGEGVARVVDGQVGKLDILRSVGQVAGVLGQRTLANLASESATGATRFSQLAGDFHISGGTLSLDTVALQSEAFDLTGSGTVNMVSSMMNGAFQLQFSPEVSSWMKEEGSRAAELFWDSASGRIVLPLGLSGPIDGAGASVDWGAAAEGVARRTIERELDGFIGNLLGGSRSDQPDAAVEASSEEAAADTTADAASEKPPSARRAEAPSGQFALEVKKTGWGGSFLAQDFKMWGQVTGSGVQGVVMTAVDANGREIGKKTVNLAGSPADGGEVAFQVRVDGKQLVLATYPVIVTLKASGADGETAEISITVDKAGG